MAKTKVKKNIICPHCGSKNTNKVSKRNNYCLTCLLEFEVKSGKLFSILYDDGTLVDYFVNEFADCG